jgi:hypothetical protein
VFKVLHQPNNTTRVPGWFSMRKDVADLKRRERMSQASNERNLNALAP